MNNYYELKHLIGEWSEILPGCYIDYCITPHKNVLECYIHQDDYANRMVFSARSDETALFLDSYRPPKKRNVVEFFESIKGAAIQDLRIADKDRLITLMFDSGDRLVFKMFGSRPNAFLVRNDEIVDAFKHPAEHIGEEPPKAQPPTFDSKANPDANPKNQITGLNPLLPRNLLPALIKQHEVDQMSPDQVRNFVSYITREIEHNPDYRVLTTGEVCLWSDEVLDLETEKRFESINETILYAYRNMVHERRLSQKKEWFLDQLDRKRRKKENLLEQLEQADKSLERADEYTKMGHLLMANAYKSITRGTDTVRVQDYYNDNKEIEIPVKPDQSIAENAQRYYQKASEARKSYKSAIQRLEKVREELSEIENVIEGLKSVDNLPALDDWKKENKQLLKAWEIGEGGDKQPVSRFRKFEVGKFEVWLGKSAKSNDELLNTVHKEDIWLHAREVPGAHGVIRMGNRKDYPTKNVILRAASYTAFHSKASGSETVPVMYTKRKYVRKPTGADPGVVRVEYEEVVMVPPVNPKNDYI